MFTCKPTTVTCTRSKYHHKIWIFMWKYTFQPTILTSPSVTTPKYGITGEPCIESIWEENKYQRHTGDKFLSPDKKINRQDWFLVSMAKYIVDYFLVLANKYDRKCIIFRVKTTDRFFLETWIINNGHILDFKWLEPKTDLLQTRWNQRIFHRSQLMLNRRRIFSQFGSLIYNLQINWGFNWK